MNEENKEFETWEEVIQDFFDNKKMSAEEYYLKDRLKEIGKMYSRCQFFKREETKYIFDTKKNKRAKNQTSIDFQRDRFQEVIELADRPDGFDVESENKEYQERLKEISDKYEPRHWMSENSSKASNVSFATHVIKLTHSAIDASSIFDEISCTKDDYLTTSSLKDKVIDGAVIGNQYAPIYQFLELELDGVKLASTFSAENCDSLNTFSEDEKQMNEWNNGFREALSGSGARSHNLAKQIYFPTKDNIEDRDDFKYRLLCNIKSSSLAQSIHEKLDDRYSIGRKQKEKGRYSNQLYSLYIPKATLKITASNHGNASQLNGKRGGRLNLLTCQPPPWQSQLKPPIKQKTLFGRGFYLPGTKEDIDYLREYLLRFERIDLSIKNPERLKWIERWVRKIMHEFLIYIASIQKLPAGWSSLEDIALIPEHQYLLDPFRQDEAFQSARKASDWQNTVCNDFGWWLNNRLRGKDKKFTPQAEHRRSWAKLLEAPLREHNEMVESARKQYKGVGT